MDPKKLWKILQELGIPDHLTCLLRTCMQVKKQQLEPDMEQWTESKLGKKYTQNCQGCILKYFSAIKNEFLLFVATQMDLEGIILSKIRQI